MANPKVIRTTLLQYVVLAAMGACIFALFVIGSQLFEKLAGRALL